MEEEMDVSQYLEIFLDETNEHLQNLNTQILELESDLALIAVVGRGMPCRAFPERNGRNHGLQAYAEPDP